MKIETARVVEHGEYAGAYRLLRLAVPAIADSIEPGQFIHLRVPRLDSALLRRPFSIFEAGDGVLSILYKPVGKGTHAMTRMESGDEVSVMGPLGRGFPTPAERVCPVIVAGGYGVAPLSFLADRLEAPGVAFIGGATAADVLCVDRLAERGWTVTGATEDGSLGRKGLVTDAVREWLASRKGSPKPAFYACGPDGMLRAVGDLAIEGGWKAWLSLDKHMGCGVGACLACVQRVMMEDGTEVWARVCREGPVFEAREIVWE